MVRRIRINMFHTFLVLMLSFWLLRLHNFRNKHESFLLTWFCVNLINHDINAFGYGGDELAFGLCVILLCVVQMTLVMQWLDADAAQEMLFHREQSTPSTHHKQIETKRAQLVQLHLKWNDLWTYTSELMYRLEGWNFGCNHQRNCQKPVRESKRSGCRTKDK